MTELLGRLLEILEEENAFDRTGNEPVLHFVHPEELQVSLSTANCGLMRTCDAILLRHCDNDAVVRLERILLLILSTSNYAFFFLCRIHNVH